MNLSKVGLKTSSHTAKQNDGPVQWRLTELRKGTEVASLVAGNLVPGALVVDVVEMEKDGERKENGMTKE